MKRAAEEPADDAAALRRSRRRVRVFVALHLAAALAIYAVALTLGGGFAEPPMPPSWPSGSRPSMVVAPPPVPLAVEAPASTVGAGAFDVPPWARRADVAAPWAPRHRGE